MSSEICKLTPSGRIKKPSYANIASWKKSKKTELIHIDDKENQSNDEEEVSHNSDTDDINEYKKQEIDYDNEDNL
ncbi:11896_t:CDS:2 [Funneliformis caledonium]|uniref:11896_t:CDS:1 n=1 Tax=Funneliformis caledonium TaxID=1117310 RepID=A0A9N9C6I6_9GLOM|nr:11896_t:CDS:2 [Funneliformis caledonium]